MYRAYQLFGFAAGVTLPAHPESIILQATAAIPRVWRPNLRSLFRIRLSDDPLILARALQWFLSIDMLFDTLSNHFVTNVFDRLTRYRCVPRYTLRIRLEEKGHYFRTSHKRYVI
jgi:hypothetical protein